MRKLKRKSANRCDEIYDKAIVRLNKLTLEQRLEVAIRSALVVYHEPAFVKWGKKWLDGTDSPYNAMIGIADTTRAIKHSTYRGTTATISAVGFYITEHILDAARIVVHKPDFRSSKYSEARADIDRAIYAIIDLACSHNIEFDLLDIITKVNKNKKE